MSWRLIVASRQSLERPGGFLSVIVYKQQLLELLLAPRKPAQASIAIPFTLSMVEVAPQARPKTTLHAWICFERLDHLWIG